MTKRVKILFILMGVILSSCFDSPGVRKSISARSSVDSSNDSDNSSDDNADSTSDDIFIPSVELRHMVDPMNRSFKGKITIPKNYNGYFYLSGINIGTLSDRLVKVRFKFGRELESVTLPATVGRATGLTPSSDIQVLIIDMSSRPFSHLRLLYDLYDYNSYSSSSSPVSDIYNSNLYCRGLNLSYDPTFAPYKSKCASTNNCSYSMQDCDHPSDVCYYAYGKIKDNGLMSSQGILTNPNQPQVDLTGNDFDLNADDSISNIHLRNVQNLKKCLPDNGVLRFTTTSGYKRIEYDGSGSVAGIGQEVITLTSGNTTLPYSYQGPYRVIGKSQWVIKPYAAIGTNGLFEETLSGYAGVVEKGIKSLMFPRAGKMDLESDVKHISSLNPFVSDVRSIDSLLSSGLSDWMDGCNLRVSQFDSYLNEHIGSCNVTALIEIITNDVETGDEIIITSTPNVKLQLTRSRDLDFQGEETIYQTLKSCTTTRTCGSEECCFNQRCWSKELVSQCFDDISSEGNYSNGELCSSDYQCISLCCDRSLGRCANHNPNLDPAVYCSKSAGDYCVAKEWCRQEPVRDCKIIKTGVSPTGQTTCALRCYNKMVHGECLSGICVSPQIPPIPSFDPLNPDCSNAEAAPITL